MQALGQLLAADSIALQAPTGEGFAPLVDDVSQQFDSLSAKQQSTLLAQRIQDALGHVRRHQATDHLEDELKYLGDMDADRVHDGYALVRMIIWATPMLGFLGTVIGITLALGDLSPEALVNSPKEAMEGLLSGLSVAFDTTALALTLSIMLMFAQFVTLQVETQLLAWVDRQATRVLAPLFRLASPAGDPQSVMLRQMAGEVLGAMEQNTRIQTELWRGTLQQSQEQWAELMRGTGQTLQGALAGAMHESLERHAANLAQVEAAAGKTAQSNWEQWHAASAETLRQLRTQQAELLNQGELLKQVLQATGEVMSLEQALNQNLGALAGAKNFEDTVMSLSAAIHLLSSRLGRAPARPAQIKLEPSVQERAA
jgi:biopolymer transport protein ExbB/TolQ